jgi:predicted SnoaL-like aldol condensation-catalyzing enzyme
MSSSNAQLVRQAMIELFVHKDVTAIDRYWARPYLQHNPSLPDGLDMLADIVAGLPANFKYEPGMITSQGDLVMIHGRYTGWGPRPIIAVDLFLVKEGRLVEHWDVMQEELPTSKTQSQRPMFSYPQWSKPGLLLT